ncbi:MAG: hypothetical protein EZS28_003919 [Streblomastix strix]|uniref:Uncharacterized protein n=1 Tax=Streblomastix strix TaxID=222440 RepID=A0A5J4X1B9_9EUKA|nr:MAG: hypothetical protein EZS28_003919 [Streblomastix strix]
MVIGEENEEEEWIDAFSRPWKEEIFWIHPPIPKIGKAQIALEKIYPNSGQLIFWSEHVDSEPREGDDEKEGHTTPGNIVAFFMDEKLSKEENQQQNFQTM